MSAAVPYELPRIDALTAEHLDLIASRLMSGEFTLGGDTWRFSLTPISGPVPWPAAAIQVSMEWSGGRLHLIASRDVLALLYAHRFPSGALDVLPKDLAIAALQLAWSEATSRLEELSGRKVRLVRSARAAPGALDGAPFRYSVSLDSAGSRDGIRAIIAADAAGLALLALLARRLPSKPRVVDPNTPVPLLLEVGEMQIKVSAVRGLGVNDLLLPDTVIDAVSPTVWLRADSRRAARAKLDAQSLVIESVLQEDSSMPDTPAPMAKRDPPKPIPLDDLEIRLAFDLGHKTVTLGRLAALQPGQVIALDAPDPRLVAIRANGYLIGRGELVRLDDRVGVRVVELAAPEIITDSTGNEAS